MYLLVHCGLPLNRTSSIVPLEIIIIVMHPTDCNVYPSDNLDKSLTSGTNSETRFLIFKYKMLQNIAGHPC